ncbi:ISLre2 family transposase [Lactococcus petauri]|uniref:ISLre2 family transposase n=1 Tax=Lactococcus petauri TaxID=1940789 RepID=UPI002078EF8E|nr:ISLre2 family transposase [Lactococcus petauri]USI65288.1 ISLre2 family transposase [Lactococcus petauri]USI67783.1 ISLre2 family transposase [Lactococcus petauri]WJE12444.1 ISLre2 family transposase [Lactococcus petauri]
MLLRNKKKIKPIDEREMVSEFKKGNLSGFHNWIKKYDKAIKRQLIAEGWSYETTSQRTVIFTFGEVTFRRKGYKRNGVWRYPVDERLGLEKHSRHSRELLFQVARLATLMAYRKVTDVIEMVYNVYITKDTVRKAVRTAARLYNERDEYKYYEESQQIEKIKSNVIYIEGDGVMVRTTSGERHWTDLTHFVIHTGSLQVSEGKYPRWELQNKREIISVSYEDAVDKLKTCLNNFYDLTPETILITNSDMGKGYGVKTFKSIARLFEVEHHEHFYDAYHINKDIKRFFKKQDEKLTTMIFHGIEKHDKKEVRLALDSVDDSLMSDKEWEEFSKFSRRLLSNFQYTTPAKSRGFTSKGIGIMESQHRKITYRMKNNGMYWGIEGAQAMSRMIIEKSENILRELFFGDWREEFEHYKALPENLSEYLKPIYEEYTPPTGQLHLPDGKRLF